MMQGLAQKHASHDPVLGLMRTMVGLPQEGGVERMNARNPEVRGLGEALGAEVCGIDLATRLGESERSFLKDA